MAEPIWYSYEPGGDVVFVFESASEKIKLFEAAGQASLCVQNEAMPYKYVTVEGPTVVGDTNDDVQRTVSPNVGTGTFASVAEGFGERQLTASALVMQGYGAFVAA